MPPNNVKALYDYSQMDSTDTRTLQILESINRKLDSLKPNNAELIDALNEIKIREVSYLGNMLNEQKASIIQSNNNVVKSVNALSDVVKDYISLQKQESLLNSKNITINYPASSTVSLSSGESIIDFYNGTFRPVSGASANMSDSLQINGLEYVRSFTIYLSKTVDVTISGKSTLTLTVRAGVMRIPNVLTRQIKILASSATDMWISGSSLPYSSPEIWA